MSEPVTTTTSTTTPPSTPDPLGPPTGEFPVKEMVSKPTTWTLRLYPQRLRLVPPAERDPSALPHDVHRPEVGDRIELLDALFAPRLLSVKLTGATKKKTPFKLDQAAFAAVQDWIGYENALRTALKHRMGWSLTIGVLFIATAIPVGKPGEPGAIPFNPLNLALGLSLLALVLASKLKPHRVFFLLDGIWVLVLAAQTLSALLRGGAGKWWWAILVIQILFIIGGVRQFVRFSRARSTAGIA